jgi:hypothetical protein
MINYVIVYLALLVLLLVSLPTNVFFAVLLLVSVALPALLTWLAAGLVTSALGRSPWSAAVRIAAAIAALVPVGVYFWAATQYSERNHILATLVSAIVTAVVVAIRTARTGDRRATFAATVFAIAYGGALVAIPNVRGDVELVRISVLGLLLLLNPAFLTWLAVALVTSARGRSAWSAAGRIAAAIAALVTASYLVLDAWFYHATPAVIDAGIVVLAWLIVSAVVVAIRNARTGDRRAPLAAAVFAIAYAGALVAVTYLPIEVWHARWDDCAAPKAVAALERYRTAVGSYPATFWDIEEQGSDLDLGPGACYPNDSTNWLYTRSGGGYTLAYWRRYPVVGARVCRHASDSPGWACAWNDWTPFAPPP